MKVNAKRLIAALLASVLLITDGTAGFAAETQTDMEQNELEILEGNLESEFPEEAEEEFLQEAAEEEEQPYVLFEMEELREQSVKQYRLSDGTVLAAQYGMDVHYEDEYGEWAEIDNRFLYEAAEDIADFDGYKSAEGAVEFKFAPQVQEGELVKITHEDYEVGFEMLPSAVEEKTENVMTASLEENEESAELAPAQISFLQGEVLNVEEVPAELAAVPAVMSLEEEAEVIWADVSPGTPSEEEAELFEGMKVEDAVTSVGYGNVLPGVSLQYVLSGSSLKEYILVNEKSDSYSYDFAMNLENLEPQMQEDGSILLQDAESEEAVYEIPAGYMTDAAGESSDAVMMSVTGNAESGWILNVTADAGWINAEERVLPVQIDPTLNKLMEVEENIRVGQVKQEFKKEAFENPINMEIGSISGEHQMCAYVQFRNLPILPKNSVICRAACYFDIVNIYPYQGSILNVVAKKVTGNTSWDYKFTWDNQPAVDSKIMDYQKIQYSQTNPEYVGWDITELVKEHYSANDSETRVSAFAMIGHRVNPTDTQNRTIVRMRMYHYAGYPLFSVTYRDTKGIEDYFTYQVHDAGYAGTAYIGDYNGQLTVVKPVGYYESTAMSYGLNLVYNSAYPNTYFSHNGTSILSKNFSNMRIAAGWKLSAQETVTTVTLEDVNLWGDETETLWLVYNDSDGTEHYFKRPDPNVGTYEDEDGLNLTIIKNGSDFTMKDKKDNEKFFKNGYLTNIKDANGNQIHIVYNGGTPDNNVPSGILSIKSTS